MFFAQPVERVPPIANVMHGIAFGSQVLRDTVREMRIVFHDQDDRRGLRDSVH